MNEYTISAFVDELSKIAQGLTPDQQKRFHAGMRRIIDEDIAAGKIVGDQPSEEEVAAAKMRLQPEKEPPHPAAIVGSGLAGLGLGYSAGHLTMHGLNKLLKKRESGKGIPSGVLKAAPVLSSIAGLGLGAHQAHTWDKVRKSMSEREKADERQDS